MSFFEELKRRNVVRVGVAYSVAGWLLAQVVQLAADSFEAPAWVMKMLITILVIGFPVALVFSWAYELTPDGIRREKEVTRSASITHQTARKLDYLTIALLVGVFAVVVLDRYVLPGRPAPVSSPTSEALQADSNPKVEMNSIAVLPFVNMSADPEQEYFSDGISEELLNLLVRVDGLTVASRTSSFAYKDTPGISIAQIADDLKVANILEGSVRKSGDTVRITAQLIDTRNDRHLWSETYDRKLNDIFVIQDDIANAIVTALRSELGVDMAQNSVTVPAATGNVDAYQLYLQARELVRARRDLGRAVKLLERAVALDPEFARAWAELSLAAYLGPAWNVTDRDYADIAIRAAQTAIELDAGQSIAWMVQSRFMFREESEDSRGDYEAQQDALNKAIEHDNLNATAWLWRGVNWSELGFHERGLADLEQCLQIDPAYQNCRLHVGMIHILMGNDKAADDVFLRLANDGFLTYMAVHVPWLVRQGRELEAALAAYHVSRHPDFPAREWLEALRNPGRDYSSYVAKAERWLAEDPHIGMNPALMLAFGAYDKIIIEQGLVMNWIWQPGFPGFYDSGMFKRLVEKKGILAHWRQHGFPPQCRAVGDDDFECEIGG